MFFPLGFLRAGDPWFEQQAKLATPTEQRGFQKGPEPVRVDHDKSLRHGMEPAGPHDERPAMRGVGRNQLVFEAKLPAEVNRPGQFVKKTVGAAFDQEFAPVVRVEHAAKSVAGFEQFDP